MLKDLQKLIGQKGSMMVEALAMLGLISMVTPVLYKKAAERTSELQDINSATQLRTLVKAMDDYIKDNYVTLSAGAQKQTVTAAQLKPYLPYGFNASATSKVFKPFKMAVRKEVAGGYTSLTGIVVAEPSTALPRLRSTKIAAMVGANGGWAENGADAVGVQGGWTAKLSDYGLTAGAGSLAATSVHSIASSSIGGGADDVLYRANMGNKDFNTMKVSLYMGGNAIREIDKLISKATGSTVTIGSGNDGTGQAHLTVKGNTNMVNLVASGTGSIAQAFTASSTSSLKGAVTAGSTITAAGLVTANNGLTVNTAKLTANAGATVANGLTVSSGGLSVAKDGATIAGGATISDGATVTGGATISGGATVTGGLTADTGTITGNLGVGETLTTKNLTVTNNLGVTGNLTVGGTGYFGKLLTANNGLTVNNALLTANKGLTVSGGATVKDGGLKVTAGGATISAGGLSVAKDGATIAGGATVTGGLTADTANISSSDFIVSGNDITIKPNNGAGALTIKSPSFDSSTTGTAVKGAGNDFTVGTDGTQANSTFYVDNNATATAGTNKSIYVRKGVMEIAANADKNNPTGYIKLDRIVDNTDYVSPGVSYNIGTAYDEYMVNPAYTSVMHDIKLTTRGGARLSDILPEFINKGIYVIDNTYKESAVGDWGTMTLAKAQALSTSTSSTDVCDSDGAMCIASPWLGFVPTPQCPAGYAKVITINPIRWKMAEAYSVTAATLNSANIASGLIFERPTYPKRLQLTQVSGAGLHTHEPEADVMPLTFQVNTWLNTTIKGCKGTNCSSGDFKGWHAIMGFLYRSNDYEDYLRKIEKWGTTAGKVGANKIIWNLFPVYKEELTAISEVYCYFERRKEFNAWNKALVDTTYDQLTSFRGDNKKDDTNGYVTRLNDTKLKYTDPW